MDVIMSRAKNYLACQTVKRFAEVSSTENFNSYSELHPPPPVPTPVVCVRVRTLMPACVRFKVKVKMILIIYNSVHLRLPKFDVSPRPKILFTLPVDIY